MSCLTWYHAVSTRRHPVSSTAAVVYQTEPCSQQVATRFTLSDRRRRKQQTKGTCLTNSAGRQQQSVPAVPWLQAAPSRAPKRTWRNQSAQHASVPHTACQCQHLQQSPTQCNTHNTAIYSRLLRIMWDINLLTRQQKCAKSNITQAANSNNNSNMIH